MKNKTSAIKPLYLFLLFFILLPEKGCHSIPVSALALRDCFICDILQKDSYFRFDRVLIPYVQRDLFGAPMEKQSIAIARKYLRFSCATLLKSDKAEKWKPSDPEEERRVFFDVIKRLYSTRMFNFLVLPETRQFPGSSEDIEDEILLSLVKFLFLLSGDQPLSTFFPHRFHESLLNMCISMYEGTEHDIRFLKDVGIELYDLIELVQGNPSAEYVASFILEVLLMIRKVHDHDIAPDKAEPIAGTYDPSKGTAYYFTDHGQQLRRQPDYGFKSEGKTTDTKNELDDDCTKIYPGISFGGFGSCQFIFCPKHYHCYGFHLIYGSEGRKDPFSALYKYKPSPPEEFFYDFACNLSEYCLNREPAFFCCTRFWHDLFHGINHVCGEGFKSDRVTGLQGLNTEVCEQFNSFLQCVKYTGSHLTQVHFMLFAQFMIFLWNRDKTERFERRQAVMFAAIL